MDIWYEILRIDIINHEIFTIDPVDGDLSRFFALVSRAVTPYEDLLRLARNLRLVCVGWNSIVSSLLTKITSLWHHVLIGPMTERDRLLPEISLAKVLVSDAASLFGGCTLVEGVCDKCDSIPQDKIHLRDVFEPEGPMNADNVRDHNPGILHYLLDFPEGMPYLRAVHLRMDVNYAPHENLFTLTSERFSSIFSSIVHLNIKMTYSLLPRWFASVTLPALRFMEVHSSSYVPSFYWWELNSLETLILEVPSQSYSRFDWQPFPKLLYLKCPLDMYLVHPPPTEHPLQYYSFRGSENDPYNGERIKILYEGLMFRPQQRGVQGNFLWQDVMEYRNCSHPEDTGNLYRTLYEIGSLLEAGEVRFVDESGVSFTEAIDMHTKG